MDVFYILFLQGIKLRFRETVILSKVTPRCNWGPWAPSCPLKVSLGPPQFSNPSEICMYHLEQIVARTAVSSLQASSPCLLWPRLADTHYPGVCSYLGLLGAPMYMFMPWFVQTFPTSYLDMTVTGTLSLNMVSHFIP